MSGPQKADRLGLALTIGAFGIWGVSPLFWKLLAGVPAGQLLAHRAIWAALILALFLTARRGWAAVRRAARSPRTLAVLAVTTLLIAVNWLVYIWAVLTDRVLHASLGYYLNPLVTVMLGVVFLRESLSRLQRISITLAALGVAVLVWNQGQLPWISLVLASTFGLYSLLRKTVDASSETGLFIETALISPFFLIYLVHAARAGESLFLRSGWSTDLLLIASGLITAVPLFLFTAGARRLPLSTVGLLQYLAPTFQFLLAVFAFGEHFSSTHLVAFTFIWSALVLFSWDLRRSRA